MRLATGLLILFIPSKKPSLAFIAFFYFFFNLYLICVFSLIFISFLLLTSGFVCSFSNSFRWYVTLFEIFLVFLRKAHITMNFCFKTAFAASCRFLYGCFSLSLALVLFFLFSSLISSLTHWFFSSILFHFHIVFFFSFFFLWLISSFMPLWSEKILEIMSVLLYLLWLGCIF